MKVNLHKTIIAFLVLLFLGILFLPFRINQAPPSVGQAGAMPQIEAAPQTIEDAPAPKLAAVDSYLEHLIAAGCSSSEQAVLIQKLDGQVLAEYNADTPLNPASVMKLSTAYLALKHFGPEHRFKTVAYTTGKIDESDHTLYGDLIIESEGDPNFTFSDAAELAASIRSQGVRRVEGGLLVRGPLRFRHRSSLEFAYSKLRAALGLSFPKQVAVQATDSQIELYPSASSAAPERVLLGEHYSQSLKDLLLYMDAHSDNFYAEQLGAALGGPEAVRAELLKEFQLRPESLYITHTSGLEYNRITPRASLAILRKMIDLLKTHQMHIEDIMPVVGVDSGTLITRLRKPGILGSVVAKTGTLSSADNGVSTLEGVIYSESYGPLLFAVFNMGGNVNYFRRSQDKFLFEAVNELGTPLQTVRTENIFAQNPSLQLAINDAPSGRLHLHLRRTALRLRHSRRAVRYHRL